jgi:transposase-like protein
MKPVCPFCDSKKYVKHGFNQKIILIKGMEPFKIRLQRYKCKNCDGYYQTHLDKILKQNSTYNNEIKEYPSIINALQRISLRNISKIIELDWNKRPSPQSIKNWLSKTIQNRNKDTKADYSGYYNYDEQYVKINGKWMFRLALFDVKSNILVKEKIEEKLNPQTVKSFLNKIQDEIPIIAITTDHKPYYRNIMDKLRIKHQLCIFHLKKELNTKIKRIKHKNKLNQEEIEQIKNIKNLIFEIIDSKNYNESKILFNKLKKDINNHSSSFIKFIKKKFLKNFKRYTNYLKDRNITKTSNKIENYFRNTLPKGIKRIFKTKKGLQEQLTLQKEKWETKQKIKNIN